MILLTYQYQQPNLGGGYACNLWLTEPRRSRRNKGQEEEKLQAVAAFKKTRKRYKTCQLLISLFSFFKLVLKCLWT